MSFEWEKIYNERKMTAQEAVDNVVKDGDCIFMGGLTIAEETLQTLLANIKQGKKKNIQFHGHLIQGNLKLDDPELNEYGFRYHCFFGGPYERAGAKCQTVDFAPVHLNNFGNYMAYHSPDISIVPMTPPDERGYCNLGPFGFAPVGVRNSKKIIAQVSPYFPRVLGMEHNIHVSQIAAFVETEEKPATIKPIESSHVDRQIADYIVERVPDGACLQLGIGGLANAVGYGLRSKKHLGVHSEMYTESMMELQEMGVIDNSRKTLFPGISLAGFTNGSTKLYDYVSGNPKVYFAPYDYVNKVSNIASNDNFVSINNALSIDLTGQVCAESIGFRQFSGSGGQVDYIRGAHLSKGGQSFIAMPSLAKTKDGVKSRITVALEPGSVVTSLRAEIQYVVTEYGCVDLSYQDVPTRAKLLISIAHPDFRDELTAQAKQYGLLY